MRTDSCSVWLRVVTVFLNGSKLKLFCVLAGAGGDLGSAGVSDSCPSEQHAALITEYPAGSASTFTFILPLPAGFRTVLAFSSKMMFLLQQRAASLPPAPATAGIGQHSQGQPPPYGRLQLQQGFTNRGESAVIGLYWWKLSSVPTDLYLQGRK
ncbi:hypothetical protein GBF38_010841 [Nibea albiflora]|uniref:Uncharacterized protein n=1 Tax=Nibea albiflora TaxID=240163 RepID=A0ACB7ES02_NIBAL|nr:hypothetical protein GBF38_010841 [Nibea albiflora]